MPFHFEERRFTVKYFASCNTAMACASADISTIIIELRFIFINTDTTLDHYFRRAFLEYILHFLMLLLASPPWALRGREARHWRSSITTLMICAFLGHICRLRRAHFAMQLHYRFQNRLRFLKIIYWRLVEFFLSSSSRGKQHTQFLFYRYFRLFIRGEYVIFLSFLNTHYLAHAFTTHLSFINYYVIERLPAYINNVISMLLSSVISTLDTTTASLTLRYFISLRLHR